MKSGNQMELEEVVRYSMAFVVSVAAFGFVLYKFLKELVVQLPIKTKTEFYEILD